MMPGPAAPVEGHFAKTLSLDPRERCSATRACVDRLWRSTHVNYDWSTGHMKSIALGCEPVKRVPPESSGDSSGGPGTIVFPLKISAGGGSRTPDLARMKRPL